MSCLTVFEFDYLVTGNGGDRCHVVPQHVFTWLEETALQASEERGRWLRLTHRSGQRAIQVLSHVGVLRSPCGYQIELLPKIGRSMPLEEARGLLLDMLRCLGEFRHVQAPEAELLMARMPLLEVFVRQFLEAVGHVVKRGLRSDYLVEEGNLPALRGKLMMASHLRSNLVRRDRFFTAHDCFTPNRPENRILKAALHAALTLSRSYDNQRLARELSFVFQDVPVTPQVREDFRRVRMDREMACYGPALEWAHLILHSLSPLTGTGGVRAISLLFPMEAVFEAFVEKHLRRQLAEGICLKAQAGSRHLVAHRGQPWFRMKPDLLLHDRAAARAVLDTKWKLLDSRVDNAREKYGLSQADFYQLYAYGQHYLQGKGEVMLIYPMTAAFSQPLPEFHFQASDLRLWVLPFCLRSRRLLLPEQTTFSVLLRTEPETTPVSA